MTIDWKSTQLIATNRRPTDTGYRYIFPHQELYQNLRISFYKTSTGDEMKRDNFFEKMILVN